MVEAKWATWTEVEGGQSKKILWDFMGFYWFFMGFYKILWDLFHRMLCDFIGSYGILWDSPSGND